MEDQDKIIRAQDIGLFIALQELLRIAISDMCYSPDIEKFESNVRKIEENAINGILNRKHFSTSEGNRHMEELIKEYACVLITKLMSSIKHPDS